MKAIRTTYKLADGRELIIKLDGDLVVVFVGHYSDGLTRTDPMTRYEFNRDEFEHFGEHPMARSTRKTLRQIAGQATCANARQSVEDLEKLLASAIAQHAN